jgi:hypothetical protein
MIRGLGGLALVLACLFGGCGRQPAAPLEQEKFVQVMVSLRRAALESGSRADFEAKKQAILQRAGVTDAQLRAYGRYAPRDPRGASEAYESIAARLQRFHEPE